MCFVRLDEEAVPFWGAFLVPSSFRAKAAALDATSAPEARAWKEAPPLSVTDEATEAGVLPPLLNVAAPASR